jgi:hypothetical protein
MAQWTRWDTLFWVLWLACTAVLVAPLWVGAMTPLRDFGSHVTMAEVWTAYDEVPLYQEIFKLRRGFYPNLLSVRFAWLVSPLLGPLAAVRLFTTIALAGTSCAMLWALREFGRSRWQVFLGLPFVWGGMLGLGLVNYVAAFPLMVCGIALGRRAGRDGGRGNAAALLMLGFLAYLVHGLAFALVAALAGLALVLSLSRVRHLLQGLALLPSVALWSWWILERLSKERLGNPVAADESGLSTVDLEPMENLHWALRQALDITVEHVDTTVMCLLVAAWVVLALTGERAAEPPAPALGVDGAGLAGRLRAMGAQVWHEAREHALLLVTGALGAGIFILPAYVNEVAINSRLVTPFCLVAAMVPRTSVDRS